MYIGYIDGGRVWVCSKSPSIVSNRIPRSNPMAECHVIWFNSCECPRKCTFQSFCYLIFDCFFRFSPLCSPLCSGTNCSTCVAGKRLVHSVFSMLLYPYLCHRGSPHCSALRHHHASPKSLPSSPLCNPRPWQIANGHKCAPAAVPSTKDEENLL